MLSESIAGDLPHRHQWSVPTNINVQTAQQLSHKLWVLHYRATFDEQKARYLGRTFTNTTFTCMTPSWIRFAKEAIQERMKERSEDLSDLLEVLDRGKEIKSC